MMKENQQNRKTMDDELSIDSTTSKKIGKIKMKQIHNNFDKKCHLLFKRPQFKIDWRQLTYYHKSDSISDRFIKNLKKNFSKDIKSNINQKQYDNISNSNTTNTCAYNEESMSIYSDLTSTSINNNNFNNDYFQPSLTKSFSNEPKKILNSLDGCFKSGELSAILGPSGAGKSTFLSTLFGSKQETAYGETKLTWFVDSDDEAKLIKKRPLRTAFLPQHDHLLHHLTVYETLLFASKIKNTNHNSCDKTFHKLNVKRVAKMLKLNDCLDTRCGKLSGGQYKRVSIGQELLSEPDVIILDEPTSGLDAMTCLTTILTLKSIVKKHPISIILTIHQPDLDVFNLFDHIYVIAQGGLAIYEGPPNELVNTMKKVNLNMPNKAYNPARFIVENAFLIPEIEDCPSLLLKEKSSSSSFENHNDAAAACKGDQYKDDFLSTQISSSSSSEDDDDDDDDEEEEEASRKDSYFKRSLLSITEAISGKEITSGRKKNDNNNSKKDKKPLINIGIRTLDGKLITSEQLEKSNQNQDISINQKFIQERLTILRNLNKIQKSNYYNGNCNSIDNNDNITKINEKDNNNLFCTTKFNCCTRNTLVSNSDKGQSEQSSPSSSLSNHPDSDNRSSSSIYEEVNNNNKSNNNDNEKSSAKSDYSSANWSIRRQNVDEDCNNSDRSNSPNSSGKGNNDNKLRDANIYRDRKSLSLAQLSSLGESKIVVANCNLKKLKNSIRIKKNKRDLNLNRSLQTFDKQSSTIILSSNNDDTGGISSDSDDDQSHHDYLHREFVVDFSNIKDNNNLLEPLKGRINNFENSSSITTTTTTTTTAKESNFNKIKLKRKFDKRLSAKHNCSKNNNYPIWYHSFILTHRTWLSIIRDPIFFGIQAFMHTTIPILLSLIFGSNQEEGCPRLGQFDLVDFAYSTNSENNMIQGTVKSIRQSIGNIGIVFFEMFVLSFSINCITALIFPLDMFVLLKEYRNGWYSLRSYFIGRTLADLPIPIILHSLAMSILYYLTGQPRSLWRFMLIILLVILSSLVAQSVGLTIGALLMKSSQSAVLAAAGIVAPFFALSGFIVRIHTLPLIAQIGAKISYLYYLLNGFIILRYGFDRCQCKEEDFEINEEHKIPNNLHTLASIWIGTYSNEYNNNNSTDQLINSSINNKTNIDPNIDIVEKMMSAFKMANSYGHQINNCSDVLPYAMLDFNLHDNDIYSCFIVIIIMLIISRFITFTAIYYKVRSFS